EVKVLFQVDMEEVQVRLSGVEVMDAAEVLIEALGTYLFIPLVVLVVAVVVVIIVVYSALSKPSELIITLLYVCLV
ncbi:863_t:CDS:2, partial [Funneliformis mosseae]